MVDNKLLSFIEPYYKSKDIMHNLTHINLVIKCMDNIILNGDYKVNYTELLYGAYFHGLIKKHKEAICYWLKENGKSKDEISRILKIASESFRNSVPTSIESKILHDAHQIEGGRVYFITKCLVTGSIRGQTLIETIKFIENNVLRNGECYLPETKQVWEEINKYAENYIRELKENLDINNFDE